MNEEAARQLARRLLDELDTLVEPAEAPAIRTRLSELLTQDELVAVPIIRLVRAHPTLRRAAMTYASSDDAVRAIVPPPGDPRLPLPPRYVCPVDGYEFFRHDLARPVPVCPHDGTALVADLGDTR